MPSKTIHSSLGFDCPTHDVWSEFLEIEPIETRHRADMIESLGYKAEMKERNCQATGTGTGTGPGIGDWGLGIWNGKWEWENGNGKMGMENIEFPYSQSQEMTV